MSKEILELLKWLLKKIISHLDPPEPKGVHLQVEKARVKMKNDYEIEAEMIKNLEKKMEEMKE